MKIKKNLFTALLLSSLTICSVPGNAYMTPEASVLYQEACSAEHQQDLKTAVEKLEKAIQLTGGDAMLYTKLAGIYSEIDEFDKALDAYNKVISINPDDAFIYISIGSIYESQGKYKEALTAYNKAADIFPEYKYNFFNIGNIQYQLRNYKEAISNYNSFLETYSAHNDARENLAASYLAIKDYPNAEKQYKTLYDKNPTSFKHYYEYGISLLNTQNPEKAQEFLEKAIEIDSENDAAHLGLAQAYQDLGKNDLSYEQYQVVLKRVPNLNAVRLDYADLLAAMNKNTEAIEQYNMYIKAFPDDVAGYSGIAVVFKSLKNYDKAIENYKIAISKDNDNINLKKDIANCYHNKKDYDSALKYYNEVLIAEPENFNIKFNKALVLHALGGYDESIVLYRELLAQRNEKIIKENLNNALVSRGHELIDQKDYGTAIKYFKEAIKGGYEEGYVYYGLAKVYRATGENMKASENYEKAISIDPDKTLYSSEYSEFISSMYKPQANPEETNSSQDLPSINLSMVEEDEKETKAPEIKQTKPASDIAIKKNEDLILEGDKNYKRNNYDTALKYYQDALQLVPEDAETLLKIGNIYGIKEDNTKAINFYQKAIIVNPDYTDGWFNLGLAYANDNNVIESQKSFEKVIELDPNYNSGYAYYGLGMALEHQGKKSEAIKSYKSFLKRNNDKGLNSIIQEKIKELQ